MPETYKTKQGETWDEVSYNVYGTDSLMHILLKANLDKSDILLFTGNETLIIPDIPEEELEIKPSWSE